MIRVLIFGTTPPPIGGVTIHIERFLYFSKKYQDEVTIAVYDIKKQKLIGLNDEKRGVKVLLSSFLKADIIHIHIANNLKVLIALVARLFNKRVVYTHHNSRIDSEFWFNQINYLSDIVILVNDKEIDTTKLNPNKIKHIPAFLPPYKFKQIPTKFNKKIEKSKFVISTNCFQYTKFNNKDLYGFDLIISAYATLIKEKRLKDSLLVLVDPSGTTIEYVKGLLEEYPCLDDSNTLYISEPIDFSTLIKKSSVTVRATRSDGDSLSVRESLYFGIPVIASDVTYRPKGTELFKNENILELKCKILKIYNQGKSSSLKEEENFADSIIEVYKQLIKNKG